LKLSDIRITKRPLVLAKPKEINALEANWWITFPKGYREYLTTLGEGVVSNFIRIYSPWVIDKELVSWRQRIKKYWLWDAGHKLLPKDRALECVIVGDTTQGDELVFHPHRPDKLYVLPRHSEKIYQAGEDLLSAVDWMCNSGKLTRRFSERDFEPFDSRKDLCEEDNSLPTDDSLEEIIELARQWADRTSARKKAKTGLAKECGKDNKTSSLGILPSSPFKTSRASWKSPRIAGPYPKVDRVVATRQTILTWPS
jgi:hypothetical protein